MFAAAPVEVVPECVLRVEVGGEGWEQNLSWAEGFLSFLGSLQGERGAWVLAGPCSSLPRGPEGPSWRVPVQGAERHGHPACSLRWLLQRGCLVLFCMGEWLSSLLGTVHKANDKEREACL